MDKIRYCEGMEITFNRCPESNTGDRVINDMAVIEVPKWVSSRLAIGDEITARNIDGVLHWYIEGVEVFP